jgi:hypothetical protein
LAEIGARLRRQAAGDERIPSDALLIAADLVAEAASTAAERHPAAAIPRSRGAARRGAGHCAPPTPALPAPEDRRMTLWLAEFGGPHGPGFAYRACHPPRPVFVCNPRAANTADPRFIPHEGHGLLTAEMHPEPGASPGVPALACVTLADGRTIRVALDWCADATNVAPRRILPEPSIAQLRDAIEVG